MFIENFKKFRKNPNQNELIKKSKIKLERCRNRSLRLMICLKFGKN